MNNSTFKMKRNFTIQYDDKQRKTSKSTKKWLYVKDQGFEMTQSPDLGPYESLWVELERAVYKKCPADLSELEYFDKEE